MPELPYPITPVRATADPPYPVSPTEETHYRAPRPTRNDDLYAETSLLDTPFNLQPLGDSLGLAKKPSGDLPNSLRADHAKKRFEKPSSQDLRRSYEQGDVPDLLKPGAGRGSQPRPSQPVGGPSRTPPAAGPYTAPQAPAPSSVSHVPDVVAAPAAGPSTPTPVADPSTPTPVAWSYAPPMGGPSHAQPPNESSRPPIASDPVSSGSPFNSQSPYIPPLNTSGPVELSAVMSPVSPPSDRPLPINTEAARPRGDSLTSNISSAGFDPGADLSSFDASYTRAYPGRRGAPAVGMGGWKEDVEEEANATSRTWEEDLDRRARAGAELQKRTEEAARREQEEALQAEYWEQERRELVAGPSRPPKVDGLLAGTDEAAWADQQGHPAQHTPPQQHSPPPRQYTPPTAQEPLSPQIPVDAGLPPTQVSQRSNRPPTVDPATEIYQIKHVNLIPPTSPSVQRIPILLQNANGPCPLLALVNAITLSTAPSTNSTLSETLRVREQVSLNLLLQAVFEELMTRGADLPDVGDLFAFLMTLHTGMNVNPRFVDIVPSSGRGGGAGAFEDTKELTLYASFSVPLVHGWLPPPTAPVFSALQRAAPTYEETQTLLFSEEELITRLTSSVAAVPTPAEETLLADARLVREFVETTATQLTSYGLATLRSELPEAQVAILFRNDHFSTIVRRGSELVTLVTDAGFASHEEVVWETLADVSGRDNRFLSGDFRAIGGSSNNNDQRQQEQQRRPPPQPPRSQTQPQSHQPMGGNGGGTNTEDTDHDFALALQLQEEENVREDDARRERERNRTAAAAAAGGDSNRPDLPPRHQQTNTNANTDASGITPPPPYPPPPQGSSSSSHGRTASQALADGWTDVASRTGRRRRAAAGDTQQQAGVSAGGPDPARTDRDKCVIM